VEKTAVISVELTNVHAQAYPLKSKPPAASSKEIVPIFAAVNPVPMIVITPLPGLDTSNGLGDRDVMVYGPTPGTFTPGFGVAKIWSICPSAYWAAPAVA
jgi:hypothetical protein